LPGGPWQRAQPRMWQAFELAMAKEFRPLMYLRVIGPYDRLRPWAEVLADGRRSSADPAHPDWGRRVHDGTAVSQDEAGHLQSLLVQRLDRLEQTLARQQYLVGDRCTIADLSVLPRVAMYPLVQVALDGHPHVVRWLEAVGNRPSIARSEDVGPEGSGRAGPCGVGVRLSAPWWPLRPLGRGGPLHDRGRPTGPAPSGS